MAPSACRRCGEILNAHANFCWSCGAAQHDSSAPDTQSVPVFAHEDGTVSTPVPTECEVDTLIIAIGHDAHDRVELAADTMSVGRIDDSDVVLDDISVSRQHAVFLRTASGRITVRDLNSLNGTYVNGTRVEESVLRSGDEIQIGKYKIVYWGKES